RVCAQAACPETAKDERRPRMMRKQQLCAEPLESRLVPTTFSLHQGGNLQNAIDAAQPGDTILLDAGATFTGPITLDAKKGPNKWITIQSNTAGGNNFPGSNVRVGPGNASSMAKILAPSFYPAIQTQPGASNYYLRGLEILPIDAGAIIDTLVTLG